MGPRLRDHLILSHHHRNDRANPDASDDGAFDPAGGSCLTPLSHDGIFPSSSYDNKEGDYSVGAYRPLPPVPPVPARSAHSREHENEEREGQTATSHGVQYRPQARIAKVKSCGEGA